MEGMSRERLDEWGGSMGLEVTEVNLAALPKPDQLHVRLDSRAGSAEDFVRGFREVVIHIGDRQVACTPEEVVAALEEARRKLGGMA